MDIILLALCMRRDEAPPISKVKAGSFGLGRLSMHPVRSAGLADYAGYRQKTGARSVSICGAEDIFSESCVASMVEPQITTVSHNDKISEKK
jgi:hypothetical protein